MFKRIFSALSVEKGERMQYKRKICEIFNKIVRISRKKKKRSLNNIISE